LEDVAPAPDVSIVVFRLFQGILANLEAKRQALQVRVGLRRKGERMVLEVSARGTGATSEIEQLHSLDLIEIRELTLLYGGSVSVHNSPGKGTMVSVEVACPTPYSHANGASAE